MLMPDWQMIIDFLDFLHFQMSLQFSPFPSNRGEKEISVNPTLHIFLTYVF